MTRPPRTAGEPLVVIAELAFAPEHREKVLKLARRHVRETLAAEPGCLRCELIAPKDDADTLLLYQVYANEAALVVHQQAPHLLWFRDATAPLLRKVRTRELRPMTSVRPGVVLCAVPALSRHKDYLAPLAAAGFEIRWNELGRPFDEAELIARLDGVVATLAGPEPYTERVFAAARGLKLVARLGVGHDRIDLAAATRHRVAVAMAFGANHEAVADHAMALMAAAAHRIVDYHRRVQQGDWGSRLHGRLHGAVVGIVGFGRVGRALARRCLGFDMEILVADPRADAEAVARLGCRRVEIDELLRAADFVSLHAPLTAKTHHLIDAQRLALMKPSAYLVNTARGDLVDEAALAEALVARQIAGAALDVFAVEPLPESSPLRRLDNVVLTPHVAGLSAASFRAMTERCVESILAVARGRDPGPDLVLNPEVLAPAAAREPSGAV